MKYRENASEPWKELYIKALDSMVIGSIIQFIGTTIPTGWLECNGATITQSDYPELYNLIGGTLPDFRGRVLVGQDTNDTDFDTIGKTGGSKELQKHAHELQTSAEANYAGMVSTAYSGDTGWAVTSDAGTKTGGNVLGGTTKTAGQGDSGNLQPYAVVKHIIKAKNTTPTMASVVNTKNNSTTDGYSCKFINDSEKYSTTEVKTNKTWIDGKPIYRKVIEMTNVDRGYRQHSHNINNLDEVIDISGYWKDNVENNYNSISRVVCDNITTYGTGILNVDATYFYSLVGTSVGTTNKVYIIFEYTKTTD